jgi:hypothetical protein
MNRTDAVHADESDRSNRMAWEEIFVTQRRRSTMLYTIALVLIVMWLLGLVSSYTMGGFIHILLVVAIVVVLLNVIQGRRVV